MSWVGRRHNLLDADLTERWGMQNGSAFFQTHRVNISASWDRITDLLSLISPTARKKVGKNFALISVGHPNMDLKT